jgi:hypothetical protein
MKTTIKDNVLHIEIPMHAPRPSATGKTLTVASSKGNKPTEARVNGLSPPTPHEASPVARHAQAQTGETQAAS